MPIIILKFCGRVGAVRAAGAAVLLLAAATAAAPAQAQLYAREAPSNSAYVRAFNNTANAGVNVKIGDKAQPALLSFTASHYMFLPPAEYQIKVGSHQKTVTLEGNHFYTAVETNDGIVMFELSGVLNRLKSMIAMFNLMPSTTLALKTADGKTAVFENVAPGASAQREINPLKLTLGVFDGDQKLSDAPLVALDRGKVFSLFIGGSKASPVMVWNED